MSEMTREQVVVGLDELRAALLDTAVLAKGGMSELVLQEAIAALSSPCGGEVLTRGWLNYIEREDGTGLHLRLYLHDDPDDRPDDTEYVIILPADEPQGEE